MFSITTLICINCGNNIDVFESSLFKEKMCSAYGEDFCKAYGYTVNDKVVVEYLVFTERDTKVILSLEKRMKYIREERERTLNKELVLSIFSNKNYLQ